MCQPPSPQPQNKAKFVVVAASSQVCQTAKVPAKLPRHNETIYLDQFGLFMKKCQFTRGFASVTTDLMPLVQTSPSLQDLARAIGALEASRRASVRSWCEQESPQIVAFRLYGRSIRTLRRQLETTEAGKSQDILWSTFLLGLFEVCTSQSIWN